MLPDKNKLNDEPTAQVNGWSGEYEIFPINNYYRSIKDNTTKVYKPNLYIFVKTVVMLIR